MGRVDDAVQVPDFERSRMSSPARRPTPRMSGDVGSLTPRAVDSLSVIDDDDVGGGSRISLREPPVDLDAGSSRTVDAIRRMRRRRSRGERTRRRERSLARLSQTGESPSPVEKTPFIDAGGHRVTRYRTSPPTQFPQLPRIEQTRIADDVGSLSQFDSSRFGPSPTSWKGFIDDEDVVEKIVSSRMSTPGKLRSMMVESGSGSIKPDTEEQRVSEDMTVSPTARRLSYGTQTSDDYDVVQPEIAVPLPTPVAATSVQSSPSMVPRSSLEARTTWTSAQSSPSIVPRSSLEARTTWTSPDSEPAVTRASVDAVVAPMPGSKFVTALSVPPTQRAEAEVELQRIRESFSSNSVAAPDLPSQPSSTTAKAALLHQRRAGDAATSDVPAQPSSSKQARRSSKLDVTDVPLRPSVTSASKPSTAPRKPPAPSLDDITKQRMKLLGRPADDDYRPMLQTPLADSEWETVYEEDLTQSSKPYPFYRTPVMRSTLRSPSPPAKTRRSWAHSPPGGMSWARAPAGGWSEYSQRRYSVPRLSPPKFIKRPVRDPRLLLSLLRIAEYVLSV